MYSKKDYHDVFYCDANGRRLQDSMDLLLRQSPKNGSLLDFGCGVGHFLSLAKVNGFKCVGIEFDQNAANDAANRVGCQVDTPEAFFSKPFNQKFDIIHIGDVLEHLADPSTTLIKLLLYLKPGGILFVEGPLETNPGLIYWASLCYGRIKRLFNPKHIGDGVPHHLYRTESQCQKLFFSRVDTRLNAISWEIYETGWPYVDGRGLKKVIGKVAIYFGGWTIFGITLGNRFRGVFKLSESRESN
jgi:SAM-dependent methyltransferase